MRWLCVAALLAMVWGVPVAAQEMQAPGSEARVMQLVKSAVKAMKTNAPLTLRQISARAPDFRDSTDTSLYVFVYDTTIRIVAHPAQSMIDQHLQGKTDIRGNPFRDELVRMAMKDGRGWIEYYYPRLAGNRALNKQTYFERVRASNGRTYIVACGYYKSEL